MYLEFLEERGLCLFDAFGVQESALSRSDALHAIGLLEKVGVPVLGGDVYFEKEDVIEFSYSVWSLNPDEHENGEDFAVRTWKESREYISGYPERPGEVPLFVIVADTPKGRED